MSRVRLLTLLGLPHAVLILVSPSLPSLARSLLVLLQQPLRILQVGGRGEERERGRDRGEMADAADCSETKESGRRTKERGDEDAQ